MSDIISTTEEGFEYTNNTVLSGQVSKAVILRTSKNGQPFCFFDVKIRRPLKTTDIYEYAQVRTYGLVAKAVAASVKIGDSVKVWGLSRFPFDKDNNKHYFIEGLKFKLYAKVKE